MPIGDEAWKGQTGRRPGESGTREAIRAAARRGFAERGYDGASIRAIAADAAVDPALVHHYFGSKRQLFVATFGLPFDPAEMLPALIAQDPGAAGERLARFFLTILEDPTGREPVLAMVRSGTSASGAAMLRQFIDQAIVAVGHMLGTNQAALRATLCGSQMAGLAMARYVIGVEPIASASVDQLVAAVGPTLQRYLTGDIGGGE